MARGEKVYMANCAACHQANGKGGGPVKPLDGSPGAKVLEGRATARADPTPSVMLNWSNRTTAAMPSWRQRRRRASPRRPPTTIAAGDHCSPSGLDAEQLV